eukprot:TRINITY_DN102881_c0_g1_i1.p1 TRINITY_DN102881_c0_g1~~TRINITY_DN102881_c0_g1_i1.p1  ORF type:complete len:795 (-),score=130.78 TRINITY_DN102881_c0_g1_i1:26-2410(-)
MPDRLRCLLGVLLTLAHVQGLKPTSQLRLLHHFKEHLAVLHARKSSGGNESLHDRDSYRDPGGRLVDPGQGGALEQPAAPPNATAAAERAAATAATAAVKEVLRTLGILREERTGNSEGLDYSVRLKPALHGVEALPSMDGLFHKQLGRDGGGSHIEVVDTPAPHYAADESGMDCHDRNCGSRRPASLRGVVTQIMRLPLAVLRGTAIAAFAVVQPVYEVLRSFLYGPRKSGPDVPPMWPDIPLEQEMLQGGDDVGSSNLQGEALPCSTEGGLMYSSPCPKSTGRETIISMGHTARQVRSSSNSVTHPDPIGISFGTVVWFYAVYATLRHRREANRIISLFDANTQIKELAEKAAKGQPLPSIVVIRGYINSDGSDVNPVSTSIDGLREHAGIIEQPKNAWIEIARQAQRDPQLRGVADAVVERAGVDANDVPDVPEPEDAYSRQSIGRGEGSLVAAEILVARICAKHQRRTEEKRTKKVTIKRPRRNESYNCFHGRRVSEGLHIIDLNGSRADLELPAADAVSLAGVPDPPPLFLPVSDVWMEFTSYLRQDGMTGPNGKRQRLDDLPPMRLSDPYTLLSEFIFVDVQSPGDLGGFPGNPAVLADIAEAYKGSHGPAKFLWEPRGFFDSVRGGGYDDVPAYASAKKTEMVTVQELMARAEAAAKDNSRYSPFCEPTFARSDLERRRDQENCFRFTELAIPRGTPVTVLARPTVAEAGTGESAGCSIRLASPLCEDDRSDSDPKADRFRFRILKGHQAENLLRHRELDPTPYYVLGLLAMVFIVWAVYGYPGISG